MTYSRPYVNNMLRNHPHGEKFKEIRVLADRVGTYLPEATTNSEGKLSYEEPQKELLKGFAIVSLIIGGMLLLGLSGGTKHRAGGWGGRSNDPKYFDPLKDKLSELIDVLDQSNDSKWLATYMVEEGASGCPCAVSVFEEYLKQCE